MQTVKITKMSQIALQRCFYIRAFLPPDLGGLQFQRESEVLSSADGSLYLSLTADVDDLFHQGNETSC